MQPAFICIRECVVDWLDDRNRQLDLDQFPTNIRAQARAALQDQDDLGWHAAIQGYLSTEWRILANMATSDAIQVQEGRGTYFLCKILTALHTMTQDMWKSRNQALRGTHENDMKRIRHSELAEILEIHSHPELVPAEDRHEMNSESCPNFSKSA